jgi:hypothetical protein
MESFRSRVPVELLDRQAWCTRLELATAPFKSLGISHNRRRRHSSLGMLTPFEFEARSGSPATSTVACGQFRGSTQSRAPQRGHERRGGSPRP